MPLEFVNTDGDSLQPQINSLFILVKKNPDWLYELKFYEEKKRQNVSWDTMQSMIQF